MEQTINLPFTHAAFQHYLNEHKLMGTRCIDCGSLHLPPRAICSNCRSSELVWSEIPGRGHLAAFTAISIGPTFMNEQGYGRDNPYLTGIVELTDGLKISTRLLGMDARNPDSILPGVPLVVDFIETGDGEDRVVYLAFRPA